MKPTTRTAKALSRRNGKTLAPGCVLRALGMILLAAICSAANLRAQSMESQMQEMRQSIQELQQQVETLQTQLRETQTQLARVEKDSEAQDAVVTAPSNPKPAAPASDAAPADSSGHLITTWRKPKWNRIRAFRSRSSARW
jgi:TolA-binding protein